MSVAEEIEFNSKNLLWNTSRNLQEAKMSQQGY